MLRTSPDAWSPSLFMGATFWAAFAVTDSGGAPIDLTDWTFSGTARVAFPDTDEPIEFATTGADGVITVEGVDSNWIVFTMDKADTTTLGATLTWEQRQFRWDVTGLHVPSGDVSPMWRGTLTAVPLADR